VCFHTYSNCSWQTCCCLFVVVRVGFVPAVVRRVLALTFRHVILEVITTALLAGNDSSPFPLKVVLVPVVLKALQAGGHRLPAVPSDHGIASDDRCCFDYGIRDSRGPGPPAFHTILCFSAIGSLSGVVRKVKQPSPTFMSTPAATRLGPEHRVTCRPVE
jgi:hypothetical protein